MVPSFPGILHQRFRLSSKTYLPTGVMCAYTRCMLLMFYLGTWWGFVSGELQSAIFKPLQKLWPVSDDVAARGDTNLLECAIFCERNVRCIGFVHAEAYSICVMFISDSASVSLRQAGTRALVYLKCKYPWY